MAIIEALIDADIIAYRCAATCEGEDDDYIVLSRCNELTERIINNVCATDYNLFLTGDRNFRKEIDPEYKANRNDKPRPKWLQRCREFLVTEWNASVTDGIEADDALGIKQTPTSCICSIDKDLLQIPGNHYNFVKEEQYFITPEQGLRNFWTQMIVGDVADNVFGIRGLGPVKAAKLLDTIEWDTLEGLDSKYYSLVSSLYNDPVRMHKNAKLLWILRKENDIWVEPKQRNQIKNGLQEELSLSSPQYCEQEVVVGLPNTKP